MVIMLGIGQSAVRLPKSDIQQLLQRKILKETSVSYMIGNGSPSTTERVLVNNDSLINWSLLKIQSVP